MCPARRRGACATPPPSATPPRGAFPPWARNTCPRAEAWRRATPGIATLVFAHGAEPLARRSLRPCRNTFLRQLRWRIRAVALNSWPRDNTWDRNTFLRMPSARAFSRPDGSVFTVTKFYDHVALEESNLGQPQRVTEDKMPCCCIRTGECARAAARDAAPGLYISTLFCVGDEEGDICAGA